MRAENYKDIIKTLRLISSSAIDLVNNDLVKEDDIRNILRYENIAEELISNEFIYGEWNERIRTICWILRNRSN